MRTLVILGLMALFGGVGCGGPQGGELGVAELDGKYDRLGPRYAVRMTEEVPYRHWNDGPFLEGKVELIDEGDRFVASGPLIRLPLFATTRYLQLYSSTVYRTALGFARLGFLLYTKDEDGGLAQVCAEGEGGARHCLLSPDLALTQGGGWYYRSADEQGTIRFADPQVAIYIFPIPISHPDELTGAWPFQFGAASERSAQTFFR